MGRLTALGAAALTATGAAALVDRWLASRAPNGEPPPIETMVVIEAPVDWVWDVLADIESQPTWMHEMKSVRVTTPPPTGVGTRGEATVRILGISTTDPVVVTEFEPPSTFAIRHEGTFTGHGRITLEPGADGSTTIVRWSETLIAPVLPHLAAAVQRPIFEAIFQADLHNLRRHFERGT